MCLCVCSIDCRPGYCLARVISADVWHDLFAFCHLLRRCPKTKIGYSPANRRRRPRAALNPQVVSWRLSLPAQLRYHILRGTRRLDVFWPRGADSPRKQPRLLENTGEQSAPPPRGARDLERRCGVESSRSQGRKLNGRNQSLWHRKRPRLIFLSLLGCTPATRAFAATWPILPTTYLFSYCDNYAKGRIIECS